MITDKVLRKKIIRIKNKVHGYIIFTMFCKHKRDNQEELSVTILKAQSWNGFIEVKDLSFH